MKDIDGRIAALELELSQKRARLKDLEAHRKTQARRDDARRKILLGAAVELLLPTLTEAERRSLLVRLHCQVSRPQDRAFLGLPPLVKAVPLDPSDKTAKAKAASRQAMLPGLA